MPRQMVVLLGPGDLAGEGRANRGFSPCLPLELPSLTLLWRLPGSVLNWSAVSSLEWDQIFSLGRDLKVRASSALASGDTK